MGFMDKAKELAAKADAAIGSRWHGSVRAPKADGGGVGGLTFVRTELGWVIRTW